MPYNIVQTTAEDILGVIDAIVSKSLNCTKEFICEFADISSLQADNALKMSMEMGLVELDADSNLYSSNSYLSRLLVSARNSEHKAAILRLILEQFEPYSVFKMRFINTNSLDTAAKQVRTLYGISSSYKDIKNTFINIATYAKAMINDGAGSYKLNEDNTTYIEILDLVVKFKSNDSTALQQQFGLEIFEYLDKKNILDPLSDAYSKIQNDSPELKPIIMYAGNAFESYLYQVASEKSVSLAGKNGIINKAEALSSFLSKKHRGMINYIGQVRNAADHGADPDEDGNTWEISNDTALIYPIIVVTLIKDIYNYLKGKIMV